MQKVYHILLHFSLSFPHTPKHSYFPHTPKHTPKTSFLETYSIFLEKSSISFFSIFAISNLKLHIWTIIYVCFVSVCYAIVLRRVILFSLVFIQVLSKLKMQSLDIELCVSSDFHRCKDKQWIKVFILFYFIFPSLSVSLFTRIFTTHCLTELAHVQFLVHLAISDCTQYIYIQYVCYTRWFGSLLLLLLWWWRW